MNTLVAKCLIELGAGISNAGEKLDAFGRKLFAAGAKKLVVEVKKENEQHDDSCMQNDPNQPEFCTCNGIEANDHVQYE